MNSEPEQAADGDLDGLYEPIFSPFWDSTDLHSVAMWTNGMAFKNAQFSASGRPVIKISEIKNGITGQTKFTLETYDDRYLVRSGDLLFSWSGQPETSIGAFVWRGSEGWLNQHVFKVQALGDICEQRYLRYLLDYLHPNFVRIAKNKQTTGLGHVTKRDLESITVRLPPIPEQRVIANVLGSLDDQIECNSRITGIAQALAVAVWTRAQACHAARESTLGHLSDEDLLYFSDGYRTKAATELGSQGVQILRAADLLDGRLAPSERDRVREEFRPRFASKVSKAGDVVLTTKGTIGRVAMIPESAPEFLYSPQLCFFRTMPSSGIDRHWLYGWFRGAQFRARASAIQHQTDMAPYINLMDLRDTPITLPEPDVQRQIGSVLGPLEEMAQASLSESQALYALRNTLLRRLISGELRVCDAKTGQERLT